MVKITQGETLTGKDRIQYIKDVTRARTDPIWFAEEKLGLKSLFPKQKEVLKEFYRHLYDSNQPEYKKLVWVSGQRCTSGKTLIATSKGLFKIEDLYPKNIDRDAHKDLAINLDNIDVYNGEKWTKADSIVYAGKKKKCILTTEYGFQIECSEDHKFRCYTKDGFEWVRVKDLDRYKTFPTIVSDISITNVDFFNDKELTAISEISIGRKDINYPLIPSTELSELVGYLLADGTISIGSGLRFEKGDLDIINRIDEIVIKLFGFPVKRYKSKTKDTTIIGIWGIGIRKYFDIIGLQYGANSLTKRVPRFIMCGTQEVKSAFLRGYFSCDGSATSIIKNNTHSANVRVSSRSEQLMKEIHSLLLDLGLFGTFVYSASKNSYSNGKYVKMHYVTLMSDNIIKFNEIIGFTSSQKQSVVDIAIDIIKTRDRTKDGVPLSKDLVKEVFKENIKAFKGLFISKNDTAYVSKRIIYNNYNETNRNDIIDSLLGNNRCLKIKSIEFTDDAVDMYDLHVPEGNCYVANGFLTHNSGKTVLASIILCYEFFCLMSLENPAEHFGLLSLGHGKSQPIACTCVAVSSDQAKDGVYTLAKNYMEGNEWFEQWWPNLKFKEDRIDLSDKNIFMQVKASRMDSSAGFTNKICVFDELDLFAKTDSKLGARMVYDKLVNSTQTFGLKGKVVAISSLQGIDGIMSELYNNGQFEPTTLTYKLESWVANPNLSKELLMEEYKYRMDAFWRDFANRPEVSTGVAFPGKVRLTKTIENVFTCEEIPEECFNHYHTLACDPAYRNDAFGMAVGYVDNGHIVIDGVNKFQKKDENKAYINPSDIENYIFDWIPKLNVDTFIFDTDVILPTVEKLENDWGITCIKHVAGEDAYSTWVNLNDNVGDYQLSVVYDEYLEREANQLIKKELPSGKLKYDHVFNSSKDVADCVANLVWHLSTHESGNVWVPTGHMVNIR